MSYQINQPGPDTVGVHSVPLQQFSSGEEEEELLASLELFDFSIPLPEKMDHVLRLYYNNCNGVEINSTIEKYLKQKRDKKVFQYLVDLKTPTKLDSLIRQLKIWSVDIVNLSELCVAWEDPVPRKTIQQITKQYDPTGCLTVASSRIKVGSYCKPGGTGILALDNCNGRIIDRGVDPWGMGRWSYIILGGKNGRKLLLLTGYRTGQRNGNIGQKTAWIQQTTMLMEKKRDQQPHEAFLVDLAQWLCEVRTDGLEVMICVDANEQWTPTSGIKLFADNLDLVNINQELNLSDTHPNIVNHTRSTTIDYCLCSAGVLEHITYAASTPFDLEVLGDHRGFVLDVDIAQLFGVSSVEEESTRRKLTLSNPTAVEKYLQEVEEKFTQQNIYNRCSKLLQRVARGDTDLAGIMQKYESIDTEVYRICLKAEKGCRPTWSGNCEWSPKLATAIKTLTYWRYRMKHQQRTVVSRRLEEELNINYTPLSVSVLNQMVASSREILTDIQKTDRECRQDHLELLAQKYALQHNRTSQQAIIDLLSHEESRATFKELRKTLKPSVSGKLTALWISYDEWGNYTKDNATKQVLTGKDDIHDALL